MELYPKSVFCFTLIKDLTVSVRLDWISICSLLYTNLSCFCLFTISLFTSTLHSLDGLCEFFLYKNSSFPDLPRPSLLCHFFIVYLLFRIGKFCMLFNSYFVFRNNYFIDCILLYWWKFYRIHMMLITLYSFWKD